MTGHRRTLERALREAGVPAGYYWIEDVHEPSPVPTDFAYLRAAPGGGGWETGVYERGAYEPVATYPDEADACAHLRTLLGA
ncbi:MULTISPECIES: hypothetical protein [unclassified Streptomyces]|uniref:hypothetical protein n=1 Tax=unclassified Streptomyces TaxID=2593676 RepID=UPI0006AF1276|nr:MULTISPECIES: hypothetical protein [unclassified Streptomyces]KOX25594.1 hypothetical protein ADL06_18890 [Streptomyces sp. NRRL F-6491]KOX48938.1 hypothetical protein ADL08_09610 [Streptomyces sp. NRRL F-6492]